MGVLLNRKDVQTYSLGDKASLSGIRRLIRSDLSRSGIDPSASFDCLVAVTEACTNALVHGHSHDDEPQPRVGWDIGPGEAVFLVEDFSTKRWSKAAHPAADGAIWSGSGVGVELMRKLMDEVDVNIRPTGTQVRLLKRFA